MLEILGFGALWNTRVVTGTLRGFSVALVALGAVVRVLGVALLKVPLAKFAVRTSQFIK